MACQKWSYGRVTQRSSMRENSPLEGKVAMGVVYWAEASEGGMVGSKSQRTVGELSLLRAATVEAGVLSGGKKKKTLPSALVQSKIILPSGVS